MINIVGFIWRDDVVEKLAWKHDSRLMKSKKFFTTSIGFTGSPKAIFMEKMFIQRGGKRMPADT